MITNTAIDELIHCIGKLLVEEGEPFRLDHVELLDAYQAVYEEGVTTHANRRR